MTLEEDELRALDATPADIVLDALGYSESAQDKSLWSALDRPSFHVRDGLFFNVDASDGGRSAVVLVARAQDLGFNASIDVLRAIHQGQTGADLFPGREADIRPRGLRLPQRHDASLEALYGALVERGLSKTLVRDLIERGRLYSNGSGAAVMLMRARDGTAIGAEVAQIVGAEECAPVRMRLCHGTRRSLGSFFIRGDRSDGRIVLVESALEAMAYSSLHPGDSVISMAGGLNPRLIDWMMPGMIETGREIVAAMRLTVEGAFGAAYLTDRFQIRTIPPQRGDLRAMGWLALVERLRDEATFRAETTSGFSTV